MEYQDQLLAQQEREYNNTAPDTLEAELAEEAGLVFAGYEIDDDCDEEHNSCQYPRWTGDDEQWAKFEELKNLNNII